MCKLQILIKYGVPCIINIWIVIDDKWTDGWKNAGMNCDRPMSG